jgi:uncharacterized delta-60 repeat protein
VKIVARLIATTALLVGVVPASAASTAGDPDPTFGYRGRAFVGGGAATDVLPAWSGVVVGRMKASSGGVLAKLDLRGELDPSFDGDGLAALPMSPSPSGTIALAWSPVDSRLVVGGSDTATGRWWVAKYRRDGSLDPAFGGGDGYVMGNVGYLHDVGAHARGNGAVRILWTRRSSGTLRVSSLSMNGDPDPSWASATVLDGSILPSSLVSPSYTSLLPSRFALNQGGDTVVVGNAMISGAWWFAVARLDRTGVLDPTFSRDGFTPVDPGGAALGNHGAIAVALQDDGSVLVVGSRGNLGASLGGDSNRCVAIRVQANGHVDLGYGPVQVSRCVATDAALDDAGKLVIAGARVDGRSRPDAILVARFRHDGSRDAVVGREGVVTTEFAEHDRAWATSVSLTGRGRILAAGWWSTTNAAVDRRAIVLRYLA